MCVARVPESEEEKWEGVEWVFGKRVAEKKKSQIWWKISSESLKKLNEFPNRQIQRTLSQDN